MPQEPSSCTPASRASECRTIAASATWQTAPVPPPFLTGSDWCVLAAGPGTGWRMHTLHRPSPGAPLTSCGPVQGDSTGVSCMLGLTTGHVAAGQEGGDTIIRTMDWLGRGHRVARLVWHDYTISGLAEVPGGHLVSVDVSGQVAVWGIGGAWPCLSARALGCGWTCGLASLGQGRLATAGEDSMVTVWDAVPAASAATSPEVFNTGAEQVSAIAQSGDGGLVVASEGTVSAWHQDTTGVWSPTPLHTDAWRVCHLQVLGPGRVIAGGKEGDLVLCGTEPGWHSGHPGVGMDMHALCMDGDGHLVSASEAGGLSIWEASTGEQVGEVGKAEVGQVCSLALWRRPNMGRLVGILGEMGDAAVPAYASALRRAGEGLKRGHLLVWRVGMKQK